MKISKTLPNQKRLKYAAEDLNLIVSVSKSCEKRLNIGMFYFSPKLKIKILS